MKHLDGYFETDYAFSYSCTPFYVHVSAEGFQPQTMTFYLPVDEGWPNPLPDEIMIKLQSTLKGH